MNTPEKNDAAAKPYTVKFDELTGLHYIADRFGHPVSGRKPLRAAVVEAKRLSNAYGNGVQSRDDQIVKLLDRKQVVVLYRNENATYTAAVVSGVAEQAVIAAVAEMDDFALTHTDDLTPAKALHRLSEKMLRTGDYEHWPSDWED